MTVSLSQMRGTVKSFHPVTRNRVQIELKEHSGIYELFLDQSWVVFVNDTIKIAGYKDETGKFIGLAYRNCTKEVMGWTEGGEDSDLSVRVRNSFVASSKLFIRIGYALVVVGFLLSLTLFGAIVGIPFMAFGYFGFVR